MHTFSSGLTAVPQGMMRGMAPGMMGTNMAPGMMGTSMAPGMMGSPGIVGLNQAMVGMSLQSPTGMPMMTTGPMIGQPMGKICNIMNSG